MFEPLALRLLKQAALFLSQLGISHRPSSSGLIQGEDVAPSQGWESHSLQIPVPSNSRLLSSDLQPLAGISAQKKAFSLWLVGSNISRCAGDAASDRWPREGTPACRGKKPGTAISLPSCLFKEIFFLLSFLSFFLFFKKIRYELALNVARIKMHISVLVTMCLSSCVCWHLRSWTSSLKTGSQWKLTYKWISRTLCNLSKKKKK